MSRKESPGPERSRAQLLSTRSAFRGGFIELHVDTVSLPNGERCELEVIRHPGASAVVPIFDNGDVLLVRQYRHAVEGWLLEVPAGKLDPGESPETCARRETEEETGYRPGALQPLGSILPSPGILAERIWLFAATDLEARTQRLERDEVLSLERLPLSEAIDMAVRGEIVDAKSVCALLRVAGSGT